MRDTRKASADRCLDGYADADPHKERRVLTSAADDAVEPRRARYFYAGVFLVTASTLILQIVQTRILSVVAWYHLAFFVISMAMFGLTAGAVWVYLRRGRFTARTLSWDLAYFSSLFSGTSIIALALQMMLTPVLAFTATALLIWLVLALCIAVPFFFSGVIVSLALTRSPFPVGVVYGVDLVGAAAGCLGALALISATDGPSVVLWTSAIVAVAAVAFSRSGVGRVPDRAPPFASLVDRRGILILGAAALALANGSTDQGLQPVFVKAQLEVLEKPPLFLKWNSFSRVAVVDLGNRPAQMWGPSPTFDASKWPIEQLRLNIDGDAGTISYRTAGDIKKAEFLKYDVTNLAYYLPGQRNAAVIGVGGGRDMLAARLFGVGRVTGVEINPIFVRLLENEPGFAEFTGLMQLPDMNLVVDEARSWFARTDETFDVIQMSLIDTWAATGAGAFTLSENALYTVEGWRIFMRRLTPEGVFTVSRWYSPTAVHETGRLVSQAMAALFDMGVGEPRRHIFLAASWSIATLIVSRSPLSDVAITMLGKVARDLEYEVLIDPRSTPGAPVLADIVDSPDLAALQAKTSRMDLDLSPATDERPFFFNQLRLDNPIQTLRTGLMLDEWAVISGGNLRATATLVLLFLISLVLVVVAIVLPLRPALREVGRPLVVGGTAYFVLIGVGFMSIEIGLLQRMSVFLGHPIYSLSIVLFSLILATGLGSIVSDRLPLLTTSRISAWAVVTAGYFLALPFFLPAITLSYDSEPLLVRATITVLLIVPGGFLMGWGFPTGMRIISRVDRRPTPWFWGINGACGVLASAMAVGVSIAYGISATIMIGGICYLLVIAAALIMHFGHRTNVAASQK